MPDGDVGVPDGLVGKDDGLVGVPDGLVVAGVWVVVSCSVVVEDWVVSGIATEEEPVVGRLFVVSAKEEAVDGSLAAVFATVEVSIDGRLVVGFVIELVSVFGELVVGWEGKTFVVVESLSVVFSVVVEDLLGREVVSVV